MNAERTAVDLSTMECGGCGSRKAPGDLCRWAQKFRGVHYLCALCCPYCSDDRHDVAATRPDPRLVDVIASKSCTDAEAHVWGTCPCAGPLVEDLSPDLAEVAAWPDPSWDELHPEPAW